MSDQKKVKTHLESVKDFLGQIIRVGDYVVYATVSGRSPVQKLAVVESIFHQKSWSEFNYQGEVEKYSEREEDKVGVTEIANGRNFMRWDSFAKGETRWSPDRKALGSKKPRTTYPMIANIVKVNEAMARELINRDAE